MGVWEGRLVMFESLVNQQIHPFSFFLLYHSPSFSPLPIPSSAPPSLPLLLNNMGSVRSCGKKKKKGTPGSERGGRKRKEGEQNRAGGRF